MCRSSRWECCKRELPRSHSDTEKIIHEDLTEQIIGAAIEVHPILGSGLLESAYEQCLCHELRPHGLGFQRQVPLPVQYKGINLDCGYRIDIVVEDAVILELKCIEHVLPVHEAQLLTYLKLTGKRVGLLLNFHVAALARAVSSEESFSFTTEARRHREIGSSKDYRTENRSCD